VSELAYPKPRREVDEDFKAWSVSQGCAVVGCQNRADFHHVKARGGRGSDPLLGGSDYCGMAVCRFHHSLLQTATFEQRYRFTKQTGLDVWEHLFRQKYRWDYGERERWLAEKGPR
jgi:hypothetical protein